MPDIKSATRRIPKATYVPLKLDTPRPDTGASIVKFGYIRNLALQAGEVDAARKQLTITVGRQKQASLSRTNSAPWSTLKTFEGSPMPSQLPSPSAFAKVPSATLLAFGKAVLGLRQQALNQLKSVAAPGQPAVVPGPKAAPMALQLVSNIGLALNAVNKGIIANKNFEANVAATPIGMLNLERLEMTPAGIERGELLATIPLAPREQTSVVQKEWSVTTKEFTSIVTDSLDNYSESGVTENTELAQSTNSQVQHGNQFNINATVSGGCGFVSGSVSSSFAAQDSSSLSAADSRKHAIQTTRKASSRVKQEHKMTISTTTVTGSSETTTRSLQNPSDSVPMRIDYFSMMRKWRVGLYRYGLRLTYDIGIPEPGATLREVYMQLDLLQKQAAQGFTFPVKPGDITDQILPGATEPRYQVFGDLYEVAVPPPPDATQQLAQIGGPVPGLSEDDNWRFTQVGFDVPDKYEVTQIVVVGDIGSNGQLAREFKIVGYGEPWAQHLSTGDANGNGPSDLYWPLTNTPGTGLNFLAGGTGHQTITYRFRYVGIASILFNITVGRTADAYIQWQTDTWTALYNAAQTNFYATQQAIQAQTKALQDMINNVDTLTLRREENDEIMKGVLRWLLGPSFDFMPPQVVDLFPGSLQYGVNFTGNDLVKSLTSGPFVFDIPFSSTDWTSMFQYQEMVKFINEAIEWENVLYFLYSYYWDVPESWDFVRQIQHTDATRQAFLRAGSARVVLTVRKGWETAWVSFVELGGFGQTLLPNHPYMSIAKEIQAYDDTNYPGIPAANPASGTPSDQTDAVATTSSDRVGPSAVPVTILVDSNVGFVVGSSVVIDVYVYSPSDPSANPQEQQMVVAVAPPPDTTHITVKMLGKPHDGTTTPFPLIQPGEQGVLIAEWFEYTPTSGTDIAVTSSLPTIA